jgi:hypothetical protein
MVGKKPIIGLLLTLAVSYLAYPYFTLYRLGQAIRSGDASTLESLIDWPAVREGIKEDICDLVVDEPPEAKAGNQLPPFGAGFVRGIAMNVVDSRVTPEGLAVMAQQTPEVPASRGDAGGAGIAWCGGACGVGLLRRAHTIRGRFHDIGRCPADQAANGSAGWVMDGDPGVDPRRVAQSGEQADLSSSARH